ncbi:MAG: hypothetical protein ACUVTL_05450 [Thermoproteota archaeon]
MSMHESIAGNEAEDIEYLAFAAGRLFTILISDYWTGEAWNEGRDCQN